MTAERRDGISRLRFSLLIFLAALVLYSYLVFLYFPPAQFYKYVTAAQMFLRHELPKERLLDFSPGYFYLHVLFQKIFGPSNPPMQILHICLLALSCVLLFQLLIIFFGRLIALAGVVAFGLNYSVMAYGQIFEPEVLTIFFLLGFLYFAARPGLRSQAISGLFFGLGLLARPNFLPVVLAVPFYFYFNKEKLKPKWQTASAVFLIPVVLSLGFLWGRSIWVLGFFSPVVMNPGTVFFEGNNPNSLGKSAVYPPLIYELSQDYSRQPDYQHTIYRLFARKATGRTLSIPEVNRYWASKALNFISDHPKHYLKSLALKSFHFFHSYGWHDLWNVYWNEKMLARAWAPTVPFAIISGFAVLGLLILSPSWRTSLLFYAVFLCQLGIMTVAYVSSRQRVAVLSVFIFFASAAVQFLLKKPKHLWGLLLVIPLCAFLFVPTDLMKEEDHLWISIRAYNDFLNASYQNRESLKLREASLYSSSALAAVPWLIDYCRPSNLSFEPDGFARTALNVRLPQNPFYRFDRAILLVEAGRLDEAEKAFRQLNSEKIKFKRHYFQSADPDFYLGRIASLRGDKPRAVDYFSLALDHSPGDPAVLSYLAVLAGGPQYRGQLFRYFDDIDAHFYLGLANLENHLASEAVEDFSYVVREIPEYRRGVIYLAIALGEAGRYEDAADRYNEAIKLRPDPVLREDEIMRIFKNVMNREPKPVGAQSNYGIVLRQFGYFNQALDVLRAALRSDPLNRKIIEEIALIKKLLAAIL